MGRKETFNRVKQARIIPAIRSSDPEKTINAAAAIHRGGIPVIEISLAMPGALKVLEAVAKAHGNDMVVGAGKVTDGEGVRLAAEAGAQFVVTPGFSRNAVIHNGVLDAGVNFLAKPFTFDQLAAKLRTVLG